MLLHIKVMTMSAASILYVMDIYCTKEKHKPHSALRKQAVSFPTNNAKVKAGIHKAE